ncbi:MAG: hypothetical protein MUC69_06360 [Gemmatimonadales bacterium]|nr:hypothetical protein [Gemmatimonadales bacterium]
MTLPTLTALLTGIVDYAGLFPPSAHGMDAAVAEYARERCGPDAWMLGRFVLPVARLEEFTTSAAGLLQPAASDPWRLSALPGADLAADIERIADFNARRLGAIVDTVEFRATTVAEIEGALPRIPPSLTPYVELPAANDPAELVQALARAGARAKLRTGGVTADAFPGATQVARFIAACTRAGVPFKATAGLHHPLRGSYRLTYEPGSAQGEMFGFLNVFLAAAFARAGASGAELEAILQERSPEAFRFDARGVAWRHLIVPRQELEAVRARVAMAFGSCSFREPVDDLRSMGLL